MAPTAWSDAPGDPSGTELRQNYPLNRDAPDAGSGGAREDVAPTRAGRDVAIGSSDRAVDGRLMLQLGMLVAAIYSAFLCVWFSVTRGNLGLGDARNAAGGLRRLRAWAPALPTGKSEHRVATLVGGSSPADPPAVWTCAISWSPGRLRSRFRAMISPPEGRRRRVVAQSKRLRWPPRRGDSSATAELVSALESLVAELVAAGWEPVESAGSWSARRFVWRRDGEPPTRL